ncbi:MAG: type IV pili twitching motility protein PilT, partial [Chromatocurvus sp.]
MSKSTEQGMQTLDQSLLAAYREELITAEEAVRCADSANDVRLGIKMHDKGTRAAPAVSSVDLSVDNS